MGNTATSTITSEVVWNELAIQGGAGGGGVSVMYAQPTWQKNAGVPASAAGGTGIGSAAEPGRGVPDVAGNADPYSGYQVVVDGKPQPIGGTSAVAPLWAGLIARLAQASGTRFGLLQPLLYAGITPGVDGGRLPRHRRGHQRRLQGRPGLGRLHRTRVAQRDRAAGAALPLHQPHASPDHWSHRPDRSHQRPRFLGLRLRRRYRAAPAAAGSRPSRWARSGLA